MLSLYNVDKIVLLTLVFALLSAVFRGAISVIDRYQFGHSKKHIGSTNVINNTLTFSLALVLASAMNQMSQMTEFLFDMRVIVFGLLLQLSANAFSFAFRHMKVPAVIVFSKLPDFFIPILIWMIFGQWSPSEFVFSVATFIICIPLIFNYRSQHKVHYLAAFGVCFFLVLQGGLSPWYMTDIIRDHILWVPFTAALVGWRLVFSLFMTKTNQWSGKELKQQNLVLLVARAVLTLGAQAFLVLSLSFGKPVLAWPILNSTGLISIAFSSVILREHASWREFAVILALLSLGAFKLFIG